MSGDDHGRTRGRTAVAFGFLGLVVAAVGVAAVVAAAVGLSFAEARDSFVVTNSVIALSSALAGVLIAWQRPRNPVGWLLLATGGAQGLTAAFAPIAIAGPARDWPPGLVGAAATVASYAWPCSISLFLPLALLLFPDGRLPAGPLWRALVALIVVDAVLFTVEHGADPAGFIGDGRGAAAFVLPNHAELGWLWTATEIGNGVVYLAVLGGLALRFRGGDERIRSQLLWLVLAALAMIAVLAVWVPSDQDGPLVLILLVIPLLPAAITIAILRHQLLDIRLVLSRAVLYALLTIGVVGLYLVIVGVADTVLRRQVGLGTSVIATLIIALVFNPVRVRLQGLVDRALYGDRADPAKVLARIGERLSSDEGGDEEEVLGAVRDALRLPYVALRVDDVDRAALGGPADVFEAVPLDYRGERVGELVVGVRSGQARLDAQDRAALELLAVPLAVAVHATALSTAVQRSREQIVAAREEERRRLRRDLHDGLGPTLTGIAFRADAATNLLRSDPDRAAAQLSELRDAATDAIHDVRRLVYELRPPTLDELGLAGALRRLGEQLAGGPLISIDVDEPLPALPAAVEVAAYRIGVEAMTNAVRHARASQVRLSVLVDGALEITVRDDGPGGADTWTAGVGLSSIRERTEELGGCCGAGPAPGGGGLVWARLPLTAALVGGPDE